MKKINLGDLEVEWYEARPEGHMAGIASFGESIGAAMLGATVYELPPGQGVGPYHYEYGNEEWALVQADASQSGRRQDRVDPGEEHHGDHVMVPRESHVHYYDGET